MHENHIAGGVGQHRNDCRVKKEAWCEQTRRQEEGDGKPLGNDVTDT